MLVKQTLETIGGRHTNMGLKAKNTGGGEGGMPQQASIEAGNYIGRVVQILDLGLQAQRPFKGEEKKPAHMLQVTYELGTEFCKDENGEDIEDKPRWVSEDFPLFSLKSDRARSTKRYLALDPNKVHDGDWAQLIGAPCTVTVVNNEGKGKHAGKIFDNVGNVTPPMKGFPVPELVNDPKLFDLDEPDMDVFGSLPEWIQDKITGNLEFNGSKLDALLRGGSAEEEVASEPKEVSSQETAPAEGGDEDFDDDIPF
jgi:hypothetical protein